MSDLYRITVPATAEISGDGLLLRPWRAEATEDAKALLRGYRDPEFRRWNTPLNPVDTLDGARATLRSRTEGQATGASVSFCVTDTATGTILGHMGVNEINHPVRTARVGYWVLPEARGRGVARRALALATDWSFMKVGLYRMELGHAQGHEASCRIAERCGYRYEGVLRGAMFEAGRHDTFRDAHLHARLATDPEPESGPESAPAA